MKYPKPHLAAFLLGACVTTAGAAAQNRPLADPADANAPVPSTRYASALGAAPESPSPVSPDANWNALNKLVTSYDSAEPKPAGRDSAAPDKVKAPPGQHSHHPKKEAK